MCSRFNYKKSAENKDISVAIYNQNMLLNSHAANKNIYIFAYSNKVLMMSEMQN